MSIKIDDRVIVERIKDLVTRARNTWLLLIGFLAFIGLTLWSIRDADFFSVMATTELPIINVDIPTKDFLVAAAVLAAVLHAYFHIFLLKLWDALAEAPLEIDGLKLGDRVFPWLVNDWALSFRDGDSRSKRPIDRLERRVIDLVIWWMAPALLAGFWMRSMPAHDIRLTLVVATAFCFTLFVSFQCKRWAKHRLSSPATSVNDRLARHSIMRRCVGWIHAVNVFVLWLIFVSAIGVVSVAGAGAHHLPTFVEGTLLAFWPERLRKVIGYAALKGFPIADSIPLVRANLVNAEITIEPDDWRESEFARRRFHVRWCLDTGLPAHACEKPQHADQQAVRKEWCDKLDISDECDARFREIDAAFETEWSAERQANISNLLSPDLRGRDLRNAVANGAFLAGVDLRGARLEGAKLSEAQLEGTNLSGARLEGANLSWARLEGARLSGAHLERTLLKGARLENADLSGAWLKRAYLRAARLEGAKLSGAHLEEADLGEARLQEADLSRAQLQKAYLYSTWLDDADLSDARLEGAYLKAARLKGANLSYARLDGANLRGAVLEEANLDGSSLEGADLEWAKLSGTLLQLAE